MKLKTEFKKGDLVKWTFAKSSRTHNKENIFRIGILLHPVELPRNSWMVLLSVGDIIHSDETELEVINESR